MEYITALQLVDGFLAHLFDSSSMQQKKRAIGVDLNEVVLYVLQEWWSGDQLTAVKEVHKILVCQNTQFSVRFEIFYDSLLLLKR